MKILIAEDDPVSREIAVALVTKWGHEPVIATEGQQAMAILRSREAPPLALLDWMMPGMDGVEICRRVREGNRATYIIMITARATQEDIVAGLSAGADDYVSKPFDKEVLQARLAVGVRSIKQAQSRIDQELKAAAAKNQNRTPYMPL